MAPELADLVSDFCAAYGRLLSLSARALHDADGLPTFMWVRDELTLALNGRGITGEFHHIRVQTYATSALLIAAKQAARYDRAAMRCLIDRAAAVRRAVEAEWDVTVPTRGIRL